MSGNANNAKHGSPSKVTLDCGHVLWLIVRPWKDDILWCKQCRAYEPLMLAVNSRHGRITDAAGEFWSQRHGKHFTGGCLYPDCGKVIKETRTWDNLRDKLHAHYMREHTRFGAFEITEGVRLPPGSPPPF